jgi:hypothetical protein
VIIGLPFFLGGLPSVNTAEVNQRGGSRKSLLAVSQRWRRKIMRLTVHLARVEVGPEEGMMTPEPEGTARKLAAGHMGKLAAGRIQVGRWDMAAAGKV